MDNKILVLGAVIGTFLGSLVPMLWGNSNGLSLQSLIFATLGGILGIWLVYRFIQ